MSIIRDLGQQFPILGVCLGHQSIGEVFGGQVVRANELMHGKTSEVYHASQGVFAGVENPVVATRYHSLIIDRLTCPESLEITAWIADQTIMGVRHRDYPWIEGVQFHPESILTIAGKRLLANFLQSLPQHHQTIKAQAAKNS
jgi:anthranilate synthase component 2